MSMFNYSSAKPTNIVVPLSKPGELQKSLEPTLAASLLNLQDMEMNDIDQIAANADNLI